MSKISVLLCESEDARFAAYCDLRGYKKSTLIARLVRDHLDREGFSLTTTAEVSANKKSPSRKAPVRRSIQQDTGASR